jgi:hypothetical protein
MTGNRWMANSGQQEFRDVANNGDVGDSHNREPGFERKQDSFQPRS